MRLLEIRNALYTVGHAKSYNQYLRDMGDKCRKLGRLPIGHPKGPYQGGVVFLSKKAAEDYIKKAKRPDYSVWRLDTDLSNTYMLKGKRYLINSCRILPL